MPAMKSAIKLGQVLALSGSAWKVVKFIGAACGARMAVIVSLTGFCGFCCGA